MVMMGRRVGTSDGNDGVDRGVDVEVFVLFNPPSFYADLMY